MQKPPPNRLLAQVRQKIRLKYYPIQTEEAYVNWIRRYIRFHQIGCDVQCPSVDGEVTLRLWPAVNRVR